MKSSSARGASRRLVDPASLTTRKSIRVFLKILLSVLEPVLRFKDLNRHYDQLQSDGLIGKMPFFQRALRIMEIEPRIDPGDLERIPKTGPVIAVCNHPYGGLDGIVLGALLTGRRPDAKLLVNYLLNRIEGIEPHLIAVNPFGGPHAAKANLGGLRKAIRHLRDGGFLATWPSGTVSHFHLGKGRVTDPEWAANIAMLVRKTHATVVPVYFSGRNSVFFQIMGMIHPLLRTILLPREMMRAKGKEVEVRIGQPIGPENWERFPDDRRLVDFLRLKTYIQKNRNLVEKVSLRPALFHRRAKSGRPIAEAVDPCLLEAELADLPLSQHLLEQADWQVFAARANQIPRLMLELGRCREITFRAVGEGTGQPTDLDRFDSHYIHLFLWNRKEREIAGAYRMGLSDEILPLHGKEGLYTTTLFRFKPGILGQLNPAVELGRSFVMEKYQRRLQPLNLLWRGIGTFLAQNPKYRTLFGPVSISREYAALSKNMIVTYLREHTLHPELSPFVKARHPAKSRKFGPLDRDSFRRSVCSIEDVSALISEIERGQKGVPVLLRQYLRFNATMLSFNVDPDFNNCIDGLVLVDLLGSDPDILAKYMGKAGVEKFFTFHQKAGAAAQGGIKQHSQMKS